jgi:hypothetical protein
MNIMNTIRTSKYVQYSEQQLKKNAHERLVEFLLSLPQGEQEQVQQMVNSGMTTEEAASKLK